LQEALRAPMAVTRRVANPRKLRPYDKPPRKSGPLIPRDSDVAATTFLVAGVVWLAASTGVGALWALLRVFPEIVVAIEIPILPIGSTLTVELSAVTAGYGFWNTLVYGALGNALVGAAVFATPRLLGKPLAWAPLVFLGAVIWNLGALGGFTALYVPVLIQPGFLSEWPFLFDGPIATALLIVTVSLVRTLVAPPWRFPYVSIAFFIVGLLIFMSAVGTGAAIEVASLFFRIDETLRALAGALIARMLIGLAITGLALGCLYYAIPRLTGNRLYSSGLAWLSWLLWVALGSLALLGALVDPSIPVFVTRAGEAATLMLVAPALLTAANLLLTISGRWVLVLSPGALAFAVVGVAFLGASALLQAIGSILEVRDLVHGTDWGLGVQLFALAGVGGCAALAIADHALPRLLRRDWGDTILVDLGLYALFAGVAIAGFVLMIGGLVAADLRDSATAPEEAAVIIRWFRAAAVGGLGLAALGAFGVVLNVFLMYTSGRPAEYALPQPTSA